jgi:hypothetical protein
VRFLERKGFYTSSDYWGLVNGEFLRFPTEAEYLQYISDIEDLESKTNQEGAA